MEFFNQLMSGYTPILIFILLCFAALLIFFVKLSRSLEAIIRMTRYDRSALLDQLSVMQSTLEDLVRYQADASNSLQYLAQGLSSTPDEADDQPLFTAEDDFPPDAASVDATDANEAQPDQKAGHSGMAAGAALAGAAVGVAAAELPDLADLVDDDQAFFDVDQQPAADGSQNELDLSLADTPEGTDYDSMADATMEFNEQDYAHYASELAEKQAKEEFTITPEPEKADERFTLEDLSEEQMQAATDEAGLEDFSLDLDVPAGADTDLDDDLAFADATGEQPQIDLQISSDDDEIYIDTTELHEGDLTIPDADDVTVTPEAEDFSLEAVLDDALPVDDTDENAGAVADLSFHQEPESEITFSLEEEDDSVYLLDEPLTTEEEAAPAEELQEFDLDAAPSKSAPLSADEELDMDLVSDTIREPSAYETVSDDDLDDEIIMDFSLDDEPPAQGRGEAAQATGLDFQLGDESESDQSGLLRSQKEEQEYTIEELGDEDEEDILLSDAAFADEDDSDLDELVDNLLDVPEEISADADAEDGPDFETAIIIDDDDDDELLIDSQDLPETPVIIPGTEDDEQLAFDLSDDVVPDAGAADTDDADELILDLDLPEASADLDTAGTDALAGEPEGEEEMSTQDMMLTLDETIELDQTAASRPALSVDDTFAAAESLLPQNEETSHDFLLEGLMDLPGQGQEQGFSFDNQKQDDPFSLQDLDITIVDQEDDAISPISLDPDDTEDEQADENDIVLPDISFKRASEGDASSGNADDLLELETEDLVDEDVADFTLDTPEADTTETQTPQSGDDASKKSANILDFIIDE